MFKRVLISSLLAGIIALITVVTWRVLEDYHQAQIARIAESESYAARSQLIRNVDAMLRGLRDIRDYWSRYGDLPRDQWPVDAGVDLDRFEGVRLILWHDPARDIRYTRTRDHPVLDHRPTESEWQALGRLTRKDPGVSGGSILGPYTGDDGTITYEIWLPAANSGPVPAYLVAVVNSQQSFGRLLLDESPGYAISVFWDDVLLYRRGEAAGGLPESWTREGFVRTSLGTLWRVVHQPTRELAESHRTPALTAVLWTGLAIALLVGLLVFENGRAESRATAAESAERKLAELNRGLEEQIAARVRELADRSADLETITDSVAHDLRNPLNSISVNTELLQQLFREDLGDEGLAALQRTASSVKRMTEILDRLLGLSVVSHSIFGREEIDVRAIVHDVFEELSSTEQAPAVHLELDELPVANADPVLVRTLVMNLLSNAIKYTREKPVRRIEVGSAHEDGVIVYCIRDNGVGFDPEFSERMFRAFERLGGNGEADGVGLGLDIAARVVKRHDGRIWAEGQPGEGAAIYFTLEPAA